MTTSKSALYRRAKSAPKATDTPRRRPLVVVTGVVLVLALVLGGLSTLSTLGRAGTAISGQVRYRAASCHVDACLRAVQAEVVFESSDGGVIAQVQTPKDGSYTVTNPHRAVSVRVFVDGLICESRSVAALRSAPRILCESSRSGRYSR